MGDDSRNKNPFRATQKRLPVMASEVPGSNLNKQFHSLLCHDIVRLVQIFVTMKEQGLTIGSSLLYFHLQPAIQSTKMVVVEPT